jgi:hypothetical protein
MAVFQPPAPQPPVGSGTPPLPHIPLATPPDPPPFLNPTSMIVVLAIVGAWPLGWTTIRQSQSAEIAGTVLVATADVVPYQPYYVIGAP